MERENVKGATRPAARAVLHSVSSSHARISVGPDKPAVRDPSACVIPLGQSASERESITEKESRQRIDRTACCDVAEETTRIAHISGYLDSRHVEWLGQAENSSVIDQWILSSVRLVDRILVFPLLLNTRIMNELASFIWWMNRVITCKHYTLLNEVIKDITIDFVLILFYYCYTNIEIYRMQSTWKMTVNNTETTCLIIVFF